MAAVRRSQATVSKGSAASAGQKTSSIVNPAVGALAGFCGTACSAVAAGLARLEAV